MLSHLTKKKLLSVKHYLFCFLGYFCVELYIAYRQVFSGYDSDLVPHIENISKIGTLNFPQMGFEYTIFTLSKISGIDIQWMAILFLSCTMGILALLICFLIKRITPVGGFKSTLYTIILLTCGAIYIPLFNYPLHHVALRLHEYFLHHANSEYAIKAITWIVTFFAHYTLDGVGSPNIWHSPTLTIVKFIGLIITYLYITKENIKTNFIISFLLVISCFYKPSFATIFIPAVICYELIVNKKSLKDKIKKISIVVFPAVIVLGFMFYMLSYIYITPYGQQSHIIFSPFGVIHLYIKNAFGALLEAIAFPTLILLLRYKEIIADNKFLLFSWIMLFFGYAYWALLAQSGSYFYASGNFGWGYNLGLFFVFMFSIIEYIRFKEKTFRKTNNLKLLFLTLNCLLALHFLSGLSYLTRVLLNVPLV